ncbi:MAG TPA: ABC-F family ATP-binding cassette domain-containing protein [Planctomycetota bacterium]|nr:ABC-F family ATP-binding cassette domain-containing protein [Planctomycetota bacterium]
MPLVSVHNVSKAYGTRILIEGVNVTLHPGDRVGVVGANGTGKTTLLRLIAGLDEPTKGDVHTARGVAPGYLQQEPQFAAHGTVLDAALSAFTRVHELEAKITALRDQLAHHPRDTRDLLHRLGELEHEFERLGGYTCRQRAEAVLGGVGFHGEAVLASTKRLSGGERSRLAIAHLLLQDPDVLLLDEPTNHLDVEALEWLEQFLLGFPGAAVVVSHDRRFLDNFAQRILDIDGARVEAYKGNYTAYARQKAERVARQNKLYEQQRAHVAKEQDFVQRYIAGQRSKQAKGRRKLLERVEPIERRPERLKTMHVRIEPVVRGGNEVLNLEGVGKEFAGRWLFDDLTLQVLRGDRIGIVGPNGAGKTTLLRLLVGEEKPSRGVARLGHGIRMAYYRQDRNDLTPDLTVLDQVWMSAPQSRAGEIRSLLGMFLFTENDVFKRVADLSGGEQARLALARLILSAPNLLLLDEPTNHLDIPSRECLENALLAYEGTTLLVSHDRYVLERVADKILDIRDGTAKLYPGPFSRYQELMRRAASDAEQAAAVGKRVAQPPAAVASRHKGGAAGRKPRSVALLEKLIIEREEAVENLQHAMSDPQIFRSPETVRTLTTQLGTVRQELAALYGEWERAAEAGRD